MKAWNLGVMLLLCGAVAACSSDETGTGSGTGGAGGSGQGGGDGDGDGDTTSTASSSPTTTTTTTTGGSPTTTTGPGTPSSSSSGGGDCTVGDFFDPATAAECNTCLNANCCQQAEDCIADAQAGGEDCILQDGSNQFSDGPIADALFACLDTNCLEECGGGGTDVCDTGLATQNEELNVCIDENCCDSFIPCFGETGENLEACNACLEAGGGALCDDYIACLEANCVQPGVCGTELATENEELNTCIDENCCEDFVVCFGEEGENLEACNACLEAEGGEICDGYIACLTENCGDIQ